MIATGLFDRYLTRHPNVGVLLYLAVVIASFLTVIVTLAAIADSYRALETSTEVLARLEARTPHSGREPVQAADSEPAGSSFLGGQTVTIAGASLLERVTDAIARVGGSLVSSELDPQGVQSRDGFLKVIATCEVEQKALQQLLYDLEAGKPFLFIEQLVVHGPPSTGEGGRMRVVLGVSGLWRARP